MDKLRVGVIGLGKMGILHAGIFNGLQQSELTAIAESKRLIRNAARKYLSAVNVYEDYKDMLEKEDLDIAVITTPVYLHKPMIIEAINHKLHIFVEKPLVLNGEQSKSIIKHKYNKRTMVGYDRRFMETYNFAKNIIKNNELGSPQYFLSSLFVTQRLNKGKGWKYDFQKSGGGVLMDLGCHALDLIHYLFGKIDSLHAFTKSVFDTNIEDFYRLPEFKIDIQFDEGMITVTEKYIMIYSENRSESLQKGWNVFYQQQLAKNIPLNIGGHMFTREDQHFLECITEGKETICNFQEAAKTNFVIDGIYESAKNKTVEKINYEG